MALLTLPDDRVRSSTSKGLDEGKKNEAPVVFALCDPSIITHTDCVSQFIQEEEEDY